MNVNTIIFGGRYRIAASGNGKIKTIYDPLTDTTIDLKQGDVRFDNLVTEAIEKLFVANRENGDA